jgi:hypothetical protein
MPEEARMSDRGWVRGDVAGCAFSPHLRER